jgi:microcystin-dependent protein
VPDDPRYSSIVVAALSFLADPEKYAHTPRQLPTDQDEQSAMAAVGAKVYRSYRKQRNMIGTLIWSMIGPADAPDNWLLADGSFANELDYPELVAAVSTAWQTPTPPGAPVVIRLPDLIDAYPSGRSSGNMTTRVGANDVTLTEAQMPSHSHFVSVRQIIATTTTPGPAPAAVPGGLTTVTSSNKGGGEAHENKPLTQYLYPYIIASSGAC